MSRRRVLRKTVVLSRDAKVVIRRAGTRDGEAITALYQNVYGDKYPVPLVMEAKERNRALRDREGHLWIVVEDRSRIVGSVIYEFDPSLRLGKVFGAVIEPEYRGHDLMVEAMRAGLEYAQLAHIPFDLIYATTRTVSMAPQRIVERLNFVTCGIFPNTRKVESYETHGLNVYFTPRAISSRRRCPRLIPEVKEFFDIAREYVGMAGTVESERIELPERVDGTVTFFVDEDEKAVQKAWRAACNEGGLKFSLFPFHEPHVRLRTADGSDEVFIHYNRRDSYGCILGIRTKRVDMTGFLNAVCDGARQLGLRYIELLIDAYSPHDQRAAFEARFLPNAYFPAMGFDAKREERLDYLAFSRSYESLDFTQISLTGAAQRYLEAFMKCWYWSLLRDEPVFDDEEEEETDYDFS